MNKPTRKLTEAEELFVKEATDGGFTVEYKPEDGTPFAVGATRNGNLFSMEVTEHEEHDGESSTYFLP